MLSRLSRAVSVRACTGQHHCFSTTAALPLQQQDPSDLMLGSREEEEPKAVLEARKREAARSFVARKVFGSALTGLHDGGASSSAVEQDGSSQHFGNGVSLGAATTSRASTQASAESSSSSSSSSSPSAGSGSGSRTKEAGGGGGGDSAVRTELAQLLKEHQVVIRGGQAEAVQLVDSLLAWRQGKWRAQDSGSREQ
uniref:Uncharacterized protein n=1 Tax=Dunaliella tertiolecta TaxID=3047 RepID=A0A7S3QMR2_DUNTE|mmetsp:Transcript_15379/g.40559  ORF Transcript_15379/g.40559 Transcript_15379/m.40559 type:complete len:197 (-) Transcript_15379:887-1477(-)